MGCLEATGWVQESLAFLGAVVQLLHVRGTVCGALSSVLLEHKVVTRHYAYRWQQYDVIMTSWSSTEEVSKRYHQNFLLCNNNEIADLFNSFCEEVYAVVFFKVLQQQTIGEVGNSIMCLWADTCTCSLISVCNSERIIKIGQYLWKLWSIEKGSSCLTRSAHILTYTLLTQMLEKKRRILQEI